ncbi:MAG TPA: DUF6492 family protein [Kofleriaceae bacterium]
MTNCDIVIRSYYKDFEWLAYCLRSIERYGRGFRRVIVIVPRSSRAKLDWLGIRADTIVDCEDHRDDYLGQQVTKLTADRYTDAELLCHIDSDCLFRRTTTPDALVVAGRPRVLMAAYRALDPRLAWQAVTERLLGEPVEYEFMRTPPYVFPRWLYAALRGHVEALHRTSIERYILAQPPRGFSEWNALGAFAYRHHRSAFEFVDVGAGPSPLVDDGPLRVFWSWGGIDAAVRAEIEQILG